MAATKKPAAKKSTAKKAPARKSTTKATAKRATRKAPKRAAWIGVSNQTPRLGQRLGVSWRATNREFVKLVIETPAGSFSHTVASKGSLPQLTDVAGKYAFLLRELGSGDELARVEATVRT